jgi:hypothetical protein
MQASALLIDVHALAQQPIAQGLIIDARFAPGGHGEGVFARHNPFAMTLAGLAGSRVFVPSWSGWSSDPERAVATGD